MQIPVTLKNGHLIPDHPVQFKQEHFTITVPDDAVMDPTEEDKPTPSPISFIDLAQQQQQLLSSLTSSIHTVLTHGQYIMGPEVRELEKRLADFAGVGHVITCASCTDALLMSLMAHDVGPGDAVFTTTFTFMATAEVIALLGATPVFVDIDPRTFNIEPDKLAKAVDTVKREGRLRLRGIIPVDLFGLPADYDAIMAVAESNDLFVIEDAAQGLGGTYNGRMAGSLGHAAAVSFFPAKPLGCYGDGGALFTDDDALAARFASLRVHGKGDEKYDNVRIGLNSRLDTLQAAILLPKLAVFPEELAARRRVAAHFSARLAQVVETPSVPARLESAWAQYSILSNHREQIRAALQKEGIPYGIYYPKPLHLQTAFAKLGYREGDFPVAEAVCRRVINLPMHPYLKTEDVDRIADIVTAAANRN